MSRLVPGSVHTISVSGVSEGRDIAAGLTLLPDVYVLLLHARCQQQLLLQESALALFRLWPLFFRFNYKKRQVLRVVIYPFAVACAAVEPGRVA